MITTPGRLPGTPHKAWLHDLSLIIIMGVLAACGLIYEYLLSHYAGRILGSVESVIFGMIGVMIVSMGVGSFLAKYYKDPFTAFAWLEVSIAFFGAASVLIIAAVVALVSVFPKTLVEVFGLPFDVIPKGNVIAMAQQAVRGLPFAIGALLGLLIGMEIPLIARVREHLHGQRLTHNTGMIYGVDYVGAGIGAALWVLLMLQLNITTAAALTASANLLAGLFFLIRYRQYIRAKLALAIAHFAVAIFVVLLFQLGEDLLLDMNSLLYNDHVVHSQTTHYQHLTITERIIKGRPQPIYNFYINGRLQFSSSDEYIYHSMLVYPALAAAARPQNILIVGGGDGLALRNVLRWQPQQVTLIDLDAQLLEFFTPTDDAASLEPYRQALIELNQQAFADPRVNVVTGDAFTEIDPLLAHDEHYDVIIVDLPDPNHPDLNKLYSDQFYHRLKLLLNADGVLVVQSTSPFHARKAFLSIGKTIKHAGFKHVEQYHQNVPSFGEWGWSIATVEGRSASQRLADLKSPLTVADPWVTRAQMLAAFEFPNHFFDELEDLEINKLGSHVLYNYHHEAWNQQQGVFQYPSDSPEDRQ